MIHSRVLHKLRSGSHVLTAGISRLPDLWLAEVVGRIGYDVIWYDLEHRAFDIRTVEAMSLACRATGIDLMVRIRKYGYQEVMNILECGANGIMVPHCRTAAEARQWVEWTRFPPLGKRGMDGVGADADHGLAAPLDHLRHANQETFLAVQIEDREALEEIDAIAAVPGVDILFVGPADLSISLGVPLETRSAVVERAIDRVADAAGRHGKWWAIPTATPEIAQQMLDRGARMITGGGDHGFLINGFTDAFRRFSQAQIRPPAGVRAE
jgi:4-hydroxy-2-oxoheptanedioate aldolase